MGLIISASVFTAGMTAIGLTGELIEIMKRSQHVAKVNPMDIARRNMIVMILATVLLVFVL